MWDIPKRLTANATDQITPAILLNRFLALWTKFGVDGHPIDSLWLVFALLVPQCPHEAWAWRVWFSHAVEAKLLPTHALNLAIGLSFHSNCIPTMRNTRTPLHFGVVFYVRLQKESLIAFYWLWILCTNQLPYFVLVTDCTALVLHTSHPLTLPLLNFNNEILCPACKEPGLNSFSFVAVLKKEETEKHTF